MASKLEMAMELLAEEHESVYEMRFHPRQDSRRKTIEIERYDRLLREVRGLLYAAHAEATS